MEETARQRSCSVAASEYATEISQLKDSMEQLLKKMEHLEGNNHLSMNFRNFKTKQKNLA